MFTVNYSTYILKKKHANLLGVVVAFAITGAMFYGIGVYAGKQAPEGLNEIQPYILGGTLVLTFLCFFIYYTKRFKVVLTGENEKLTLEVKDPGLTAPLIINSPLKISMQWVDQLMGKGPKMKTLYLTICDQKNEPLVTFEGALGAAYSVPTHFDHLNILDPEEQKKLIIARTQYSSSKVRELTDEIRLYLNYVDKKKETRGHAPI